MIDNLPIKTSWIAVEKHTRGVNDPRIERLWLLAKEIAKHLDVDDTTKDEADFFADRLLDKLESALMYYQLIANNDFDDRNISQKRTLYEGLYASLWGFYKGRMQNYLKESGWSLEIFFCKEKNFEKFASKFIQQNPDHSALVDLARKQRNMWQTDFGRSRDASEHSGDYRTGVDTYENKDDAKRFFAQVCWTAETLIAYCGSYRMKREWNVTELNPTSTIFDTEDRYCVEHAVQTVQRGQNK